MSYNVPQAHVQSYRSDVIHISQQKGSRIRGAVDVETGVPGTRHNFEQLGTAVAQKRTTRHGDSPLINIDHPRRICDLIDYEWGSLVDNEDKLRMLYDATNPYTQAAAMAMGRAMDSEIITAFNATAIIGQTDGSALSTTTEAWGDTVIDGTGGTAGAGVALANLIEARGRLRRREHISDGEQLFCVCSSYFIDDLLTLSQVQSIDQNTYRALVGGEVTTFMGFTFIQTELVSGIGGATEYAYFFPRSAIKLCIGADIVTHVERRADKSYAFYPYVRMSIGATRTESDNVVIIDHKADDAPGA